MILLVFSRAGHHDSPHLKHVVSFYFKSKWCLLIKPNFYFLFLYPVKTAISTQIKKIAKVPKLIQNGINTTSQDHVISPVSLSTKKISYKTPKIPIPVELLLLLLLIYFFSLFFNFISANHWTFVFITFTIH